MPQALAGQTSPSFDGRKIFVSPNYDDKLVVEILSRTAEDYIELPYGTPFPANSPQASLFPDHRLTLQVEQSEKMVVRYYTADRANQNAYNASISYSGDSEAHPIFTRDYIVRRSEYASTDRLATLTGILSATVTAGGHDFEDDPVVELSGGTGTGGAITAVISNGAVVGLTITAAGNYTVAPTITITGGTGATGEVTLQSQSAVLVKEETLARTGDERIDSLYILVRHTYEVLPGPWIPDNRDDLLLGPVQRNRRAVVNTGQAAVPSATGLTTYEGRDGSSIVSWEIVESWSNGTGSGAGNGLYPITVDDLWDETRSDFRRTTQLTVDLTTRASLVVSAGVATETIYVAFNQFLRKKIIETWDVPGTARTYNVVGRRGFTGALSRRLVTSSSTPTAETELIDVERRVAGKSQMLEDVTTYEAGGSPLVRKSFNEFGGLDVETDKFVAPSTTPTNVTWTIQELRQEREKQARLIETVIATGSAIDEIENADPNVPGSRATDLYYLVLASTGIPADTATEVYRRVRFPKNPLIKVEIKRTYAIPASFIESKDMGMAYPTLFYSYYSDNVQGTTIKNRGGFSVVVPHLVTHSFGTTRVDVTPYQIIENDLTLFSMRFQGLMDADDAFRTVNGVTYTQSYDASIPSQSTYTGLIGTSVTVGGGSDIWRASIYRTQTIEVKLQ